MQSAVELIPFSKEAEQAVLCSVFINPGSLDEITLAPEHFYLEQHRTLFKALRMMRQQNVAIDFVTVCEFIDRHGWTNDVGGPAYLASLISADTYFYNIKDYESIVLDKSNRRNSLETVRRLAQAAASSSDFTSEITIAIEALAGINTLSSRSEPKHWSVIAADLFNNVEEKANNPVEIWGLPTGFTDFDINTGGLQKGEVFLIGGQPGVGKSILAHQIGLQLASGLADDVKHVGIDFTLEMSEFSVVRRLISAKAEVNTRNLKTGDLTEDEWNRFTQVVGETEHIPLYIVDNPAITPDEVRSACVKKKLQGLEFIVVDYLQLMNANIRGMDGARDFERGAVVSAFLKQIAGTYNIAVLAIASLTKLGMSDETDPGMDSIAGSAKSIFDADVIGILTKYKPGKGEIQVLGDTTMHRTLTIVKGRELDIPIPSHIHITKNQYQPFFTGFDSSIPGR